MTTPDDGKTSELEGVEGPDVLIDRRSAVSRVLRYGFMVVVVAAASFWVLSHRHEVGEALRRVNVWPVLGAALLGAAGAWSGVPAWRDLLAGLGSRLRLRDAQRIYLAGQLGKYIPGGVWTVLAQATMAKERGVSRARSGTASLLSILIAVVAGGCLGAVCLLVAGGRVLGNYDWFLLLLLPLLALLHPGVLVWAARIAGRVTGRSIVMQRLPERSLLAATGWLAGGQILFGAQFYLLVGAIAGSWSDPLLSIGLFNLASAVGILVVFAPAGAGAREVVLGIGLSGVLDPGSVVLAVLLSRMVLIVTDVGLAFLASGVALRRGWRSAR